MLDFKTFETVMENFFSKRFENEAWLNDVESCFGGAWEIILNHNYEEQFIDLLTLVMDDKEDWIRYYIYERNCNWFEIEQDGETIFINSYEKLYHLICGEEF